MSTFAKQRNVERKVHQETPKSVPSQLRIEFDEKDLVEKADAKEKTDAGLRTARGYGVSRGARKAASSLPPRLQSTPMCRHVFRFAAAGAGVLQYNCNMGQVAAACGAIVTTANTTAYTVCGTYKVNKITVWPSQASSATGNVGDVRWSTGPESTIRKDENFIVNLPAGITQTKACVFLPPKDSLAGFWVDPSIAPTRVLFEIEASTGSIVDVDVTFSLQNSVRGQAITITGVTAAVGQLGFAPLNGPGGDLDPLGVELPFSF